MARGRWLPATRILFRRYRPAGRPPRPTSALSPFVPMASPPRSPWPSPSSSSLPIIFSPELTTISSPLRTYAEWPHQFLITTSLAAAGYYHNGAPGCEDRVGCAFCGMEFWSWEPRPHPDTELMSIHADDCLWPELRADTNNNLLLLSRLETLTSHT